MPKTKTLEASTSDEIRVKAYRNNVTVIVDDPQVEDMLSSMNKEDILTWIRSEGFKPDEIFEHEDLSEWAVSHGYIKE